MPYRTLDADKIFETLARLHSRISERFPESGLAKVAAGLTDVASETKQRAETIAHPNIPLRFDHGSSPVHRVVCAHLCWRNCDYKNSKENLFGVLQGIEALINVLVLMGAAIFFLVTLESRWKRQRALDHLHELRTIIHVIDMHQLTKDPSVSMSQRTKSSPKRILTPYQLLRYLDYCSEMLSLTAKLATLYAQSSRDNVVISAVTELEQISANLSYKLWQKITLINQHESLTQQPAQPEEANPSEAA